MTPKQGNRRLQAIFFFLAIQMIQVSRHGTPRCPIFLDYYTKRVEEGKNKKQALVCIARRLVNIVYAMLKNKTEWRVPEAYQLKSDNLKKYQKKESVAVKTVLC